MPPSVTALDHLVLTVRDIDATIAFYTRLLGMQAEQFQPADGSIRHALKFGGQKINLHRQGAEFDPKAKYPAPGTADLCFLSETKLADWQKHFRLHSVAVEEGPVMRTGATGPIESIYVRDPDGNLVEIGVAEASNE